MKALRKQKIETANIQVGDQMVIPLALPPVAVQHGGKRHPGGLCPPQTVN